MKENDKGHPFLFFFLLFCLNSLWTGLHYILLLSAAFLALYFDIILKLQEFPYTLYPDVLISFICPFLSPLLPTIPIQKYRVHFSRPLLYIHNAFSHKKCLPFLFSIFAHLRTYRIQKKWFQNFYPITLHKQNNKSSVTICRFFSFLGKIYTQQYAQVLSAKLGES